jgi:putative transposase
LRASSVSNDNPYSEAQFKTLKYRPAFPERFGSLEDARASSGDFFGWYNLEHHHSGLGLLTPHDVHHGLAAARVTERAVTLASAWRAHTERFPRGKPVPPRSQPRPGSTGPSRARHRRPSPRKSSSPS